VLWCAALLLVGSTGELRVQSAELRVMTFNLWQGGDAGKQPLSQSAEVVRIGGADLVGLQETEGMSKEGAGPDNGARLAVMLGFEYFDQGNGCGILSRYPITGHTGGRRGVRVKLPDDREVWLFNVHFAHAPYQPYQLLGIPYEGGAFLRTAQEAVAAARLARGHQVQALLDEMREALDSGAPLFLTGDFNEPSHQDWTAEATKAGRCPLQVPWPATLAVHRHGLRDSYRATHPDPITHPGLTWTPISAEDDVDDRHDRIDFVFFGGRDISVAESKIVGEGSRRADLVVTPYPSDHRAVVTGFR
jgi:endonuclease/exonuclease/phosphatase family metal-dependent hydrolase